MKVSFIIPVRNGSPHVGRALDSIVEQTGDAIDYEMIVVDNGSTDDTSAVARRRGATVLFSIATTIGAVRNQGAAHAKGEILIFMDADVTLESEWKANFMNAAALVQRHPYAFSGSQCSIPSDASRFERWWIRPRRHSAVSHIGSGHLIVGRNDFLEAGGFNESLATGEDYDLSMRLLSRGGTMLLLPSSIACHHGNPRGIGEFMRRESWHGIGDCGSVASVLRSRVAQLALVIGLLHAPVIGWLIGWVPGAIAGLSGGAILGICAVSAARSYWGAGALIISVNTLLYYCYFVARLSSFARVHPALQVGWRRSNRATV